MLRRVRHKLTPDGSSIAYTTYLGGAGHEHGHGIVVHDAEAYVVGHTQSEDFPTTPGAFDDTVDEEDGFVARLSADADALLYCTLLGGNGADFAFDIAVDRTGIACVVGFTGSSDFPTTPDALDTTFGGVAPCTRESGPLVCIDGFLALLATDGSSLDYATYLGGAGPDLADGVALRDRDILVAGATYSPEFPVTPGAFQSIYGGPGGQSDGFVMSFTRPVVDVPGSGSEPVAVAIHAVVPNPARGAASFEVETTGAGEVLAVFDVGGRRVWRAELGDLGAGTHQVVWDGQGPGGGRVPAGVYFAQVDGQIGGARRFLMW